MLLRVYGAYESSSAYHDLDLQNKIRGKEASGGYDFGAPYGDLWDLGNDTLSPVSSGSCESDSLRRGHGTAISP